MGKIRQTANMLADLGIGPKDVVTYLLPNLPQTHYVGSLATITIKPAPKVSAEEIRDKVEEILARYTIRYRLGVI